MLINVISIFPKMFDIIKDYGITKRAIQKHLVKINVLNPRKFTKNKYKNIDDRPYGGGPGMIMTAEPLFLAINQAKSLSSNPVKVFYLSPQGKKLDQSKIMELSHQKHIILLCGRYEGIDERLLISKIIDEEISIGDYVLSGGELPAMVLIDSICRVTPGVLKNSKAIQEDSFYNGLLDYPHYTRPKCFNCIKIPNILLSGNHSEIKRWRLKQSLTKTWLKRPDLLNKLILTKEQESILHECQSKMDKPKI
ncbi:tRNA (Guanine-N1)-methyltransferase [Buchnera aphidicola str. Bp (Baizongia pistaciae)]|uniref:tRNA (guanine-N(1)-)-methyltransferase n=1 Tax=Buchnera aphidicola subsp. Baizongia pistaciae (strain Bp) TaxID=224915 RepID=TRMD_BUCBP|nr:tRNA (guanosine(37)-N1)-methyltransferase TrmD [Buchnera aphidicola]P59518.1 RecName: Full=tRNA (guanine-N(1)-)-methyltransferase; AltName: Full=M1G-methyltransferase; AltName: Full=tRNA [GM37] methyltransferase [Buchnera aphidicola str. Bp (Baizongia pistaciae)]AAO27078.1 tRNA (Guanine-N1)-methyltransferase [Buchnera aphidicola str. Bp (Baizongia pistaciae)]